MEVYTSVLFLSLIAAGVMAAPPAVPQENDIRLASKARTAQPNYAYGFVEVFHGGRWGSVCHEGFGMEDAKVVCRQLGYPGDGAEPGFPVGFLDSDDNGLYFLGPILLFNVTCIGTEAKLTDCPAEWADPWGKPWAWVGNQCTPYNQEGNREASVICFGDRLGAINAARGLHDMTEQEDQAYAEKEEDFFQNLKEEDEAYKKKKELELVAEILAQLLDN